MGSTVARRILTGALGLVLWAAGPLAAQELRIGFHQGNAEPYTFVDAEGRLVGGIIKDLGDALAAELGLAAVYIEAPRKRIDADVIAGRIDVRPIFNPGWTSLADQFLWSPPLFAEKNVVVTSRARNLIVRSAADLQGRTLGTILGYSYPTLEPLFANGSVTREDVDNLDQNFSKLQAGRIDALVDSNILVGYHVKSLGARFLVNEWVTSSQEIFFGFSKTLPVKWSRVEQALQKLKESGRIEAILARYR